jgi:hypothetical protein
MITKEIQSALKGLTPEQQEYAVKTLNPASTEPVIRPPDGTRSHTVVQQTTTIQELGYDDANDLWDADFVFNDHPILLGSYVRTESDGTGSVEGLMLNTAFPATDNSISEEESRNRYLVNNCEEYRVLYTSVTINHIASSLYNQGQVKAVQYAIPAAKYSFLTAYYGADNGKALRQVQIYQASDMRTWNEFDNAPSSYIGQAKDGVYSVMKQNGNPCWKTCQDQKGIAISSNDDTVNSGIITDGENFATVATMPMCITVPSHILPGGQIYGASFTPFCSNNKIHIAFRGLHKSATLQIKVIQGLEFVVRPSTSWATFQVATPLPSPNTMSIVQSVWPLLRDGYPSSYNDRETFLRVIGNILNVTSKYILPILSFTPLGKTIVSNISKPVQELGSMALTKANQLKQKKLARQSRKTQSVSKIVSKPPPLPPRNGQKK